jgi:hypothetical protein
MKRNEFIAFAAQSVVYKLSLIRAIPVSRSPQQGFVVELLRKCPF